MKVAVDDSCAVDGPEDVRGVDSDVEGVPYCEGVSRGETSLETLSLEQLHHQVRAAVLRDSVVHHAAHPGVLHTIHEISLFEEAGYDDVTRRHRLMQDLERARRSLFVLHGIDGRHAATADDMLDEVGPYLRPDSLASLIDFHLAFLS